MQVTHSVSPRLNSTFTITGIEGKLSTAATPPPLGPKLNRQNLAASAEIGAHKRASVPGTPQCDPEQPVDSGQANTLAFSFQHGHLMPQSQDFQRCIEAISEEHSQASENREK
jgi:hypothetical protein